MERKKKRYDLRLRIAIVLSLVVMWSIAGLFRYINSPRVQSLLFSSVNKVSSLKINSAKVKLNFLKRKIEITDLHLYNPTKDQRFTADKVFIRFRILPLLRGAITINAFEANNLKIAIGGKQIAYVEKRSRIELTSLLLLKNLTLKNGVVNNITVDSPKTFTTIGVAQINFIPSLWGDINLFINLSSINTTTKGLSPLIITEINIGGRTDVDKWIDRFPYVDDLDGKIDCSEIKWKSLLVETLSSKLRYSDLETRIDFLRASIDGHRANLNGQVNFRSNDYSLNIDIEDPVYLPPLGGINSFLDTSGHIGGKIAIKGNGLNYKTTVATADIDLNHKLAGNQPLPVSLKTRVELVGGKISLSSALLKIGDTPVTVAGSFDYLNPNLDISFEGNNIPAETVMSRFATTHYHPTTGLAKAKGIVTGWKQNIKFDLSAEASPGGYYDIFVEKAKMDLSITYNHLTLNGFIYQRDNEVGKIVLEMDMGKKLADGTRQKTFKLAASVGDIDLATSMKAYDLTGTGNGSIDLHGSPKNFTGSGTASITEGSALGVGFISAAGNIKFSAKELIFDHLKVALTEAKPTIYPSPLVMDITTYGIRLHGSPRVGLDIDARYLTAAKSWHIDKIIYTSLYNSEWITKLTGNIGSTGGLNLKAAGTFDMSLLSNLKGLVREAKGAATLDNLNIGGTSKNPSLSGKIHLNDSSLQLRGWGYFCDKISGILDLGGHKISTKKLVGRIEYGDFSFVGSIGHENLSLSHADFKFIGNSIVYASPDRSFRAEFDADIIFQGGPTSSHLAGTIGILDGRYTKNFSLFDTSKKGTVYDESSPEASRWRNIKLSITMKDSGDLKIDNNLGEVWLSTDITISGTAEKPLISGNIRALDGEIHYAGLEFDVSRGYMEFRAPYTNPFIEFEGTKEVGNHNVSLVVRGRINKLYLDLESTPPLDKKDILALLTFGVTAEDLENARFGLKMGTGLVAEQVGSVLQQPIRKFTPIDRFRIEASPQTDGGSVTRVHVGKDVSDRLRINFITDINTSDAQQTFEAEYMLTDFMLLKGTRMSNDNYRFQLSFRFREQ